MATRTCYGQAYILEDQLVQETITFTDSGDSFNGTNVIIENIWEDLLANSHQYKKSGKKYFYWEYRSKIVQDLIKCYLDKSRDNRINIDNFINHPWFKTIK